MSSHETVPPSPTVGIIGLGIMGSAFARHLAAAGVRTLGYDLLPARMDVFDQRGGHRRPSARAVAEEADIVITSLPHERALNEALLHNEGLVSGGRPGLLVIETSTLELEAKHKIRARLSEAGLTMLDAPISGTGSQAESKDITVFASGDRIDFERAHGILSHFARSIRYVGEFGAGSKIKYIANLLIAVHTLAVAEALVLGEKAGLQPGALIDLLIDSAATSRMVEVRGPAMVARTYTTPMMKVDVFRKDLDIITGFIRQCSCPAPLFNTSVPYFTAAAAQKMGGYDTAAVISVLRQMAGLSDGQQA